MWSYDLPEDRTARGGRLRLLTVVDEYSRQCLAIEVERSCRAAQVVETLKWLALTWGMPEYLRSDNGPQFIAREVCGWLGQAGCETILITPGSPWENPYIESFIGKLRDECLNREIFADLQEARAVIEGWWEEYNTRRPHSSLGYLTPVEFARQARSGQEDMAGRGSVGSGRATLSLRPLRGCVRSLILCYNCGGWLAAATFTTHDTTSMHAERNDCPERVGARRQSVS